MTTAAPGRGGLVLLLGLLTAFGPMSIDMYLPAFPAIAREFESPIAAVQYTVAAYMGGLALGQLLYGPLADQYGRKPYLLAGLALYLLAAVGCATSTSVTGLVGWRVVQAVGGCAGAVLGFAIVRDEFAGNQAARIFSTMLLVMGAAPILAPTVGSLVVAHASWRLIFWLLAGLAALTLAAVALGLRETLPAARRNPLAVRRAFHTYGRLLRDRAFVGYALTSGLVLGAMFAYITGSLFVFTQLYGLSTQQYGLLFGLNASGLIAAAQLNNWLLRRFSFAAILRGVTWAASLAGLAILGLAYTGWGGLPGLEVPLFVVVSCVGFAAPNATAGALQPHAAHAGSAASLLGTLSYGCGRWRPSPPAPWPTAPPGRWRSSWPPAGSPPTGSTGGWSGRPRPRWLTRRPKPTYCSLAAALTSTGNQITRQAFIVFTFSISLMDTHASVHYRTVAVDGLAVFYREAGPADAPTILLLHGFPTSSHMFRELLLHLAGDYHVVAPDLPGFGFTTSPPAPDFAYTFDHLAEVMDHFTQALHLARYALYVFDYGAPVGLRLALAHPERVTALISQNGNAYAEGLSPAWEPVQRYWQAPTPENRAALRQMLTWEMTQWQYTHGVPDPTLVAPDGPALDYWGLSRPGHDDSQLDLMLDYQTNVALYPQFQAYFRTHRPPTLVVWGENDPFFLPAGARAYGRDNPAAQVHLLPTGHFALATHAAEIARLMHAFLAPVLGPAAA